MSERLPLDAAPVEVLPTLILTPVASATVASITVARPHRRTRRFLGGLGVGLLAIAVFTAGAGLDRAGILPGAPAAVVQPVEDKDFALIHQAWDLLHQKFVDAASLDSRKLAYGAIDGMTEAVGDTGHTTFLTPTELAESQSALAGSYAGVGAEMDTTGDQPVVVGVFRGSPAAKAGLRSGDVILSVNGTPTKDEPLDSVISTIRGPAGSEVTLTVRRSGSTDPLRFSIVRADVAIPAVDWAMIPGTTIADIRVEQFSSGAAKVFSDALGAALARHPTGIVLDLRGDPGGYVNEAVGIASQFVGSGNVYLSRDATGTENPTPVTPGGLATAIPVVVLVDHGTASSAEIVTGALQDAGRATIVGVRTFGTGTVLAKFDLADGSALRIGTVEWLTPKGRHIWHEGLAPDVTLALPDSVVPVVPADLAGLGANGVSQTPDIQLRKALEILKTTAG